MFRELVLGLFLLVCLAFAGLWVAGSMMIHPAREIVGAPPSDFPASTVVFKSSSGALIHGWFFRGNGRGAILLLHGVRANRLAMLNRARFLHASGYSVLLIDFQASGESTGDAITFGHLESRDAAAAVNQLKKLAPGEKVGVLGTSMGGAATLLADPPLNVDAMILEQVYPTLSQAIEDRLQIHMGFLESWFAPLLMSTVKPHLGFSLDEMRPIDKIGKIQAPKLLIVGDADRDTKIGESLAMFDAASASKELWIIHGARHVDFYRYSGSAYQIRILGFFNKWLRGPSLR